MRAPHLILFGLISLLIAGCDTPTESFERLNPNDPLSSAFIGEGDYDMSISVGEDGVISISWGRTEDFIERVVLKKSLGDTLNFEVMGSPEPGDAQFQDSTRVIDRQVYYQIETYYTRNGVELLYGKSRSELEIGNILDFSLHVDNEGEKIDLTWTVDVPYFSYFVIESENEITEQGDKSVQLLFESVEGSYSDPAPDITFENRNYKLSGVIELGDGREDIVVEKALNIDLRSYFKPKNFEIDVLNEQDWQLSWEGEPFFSDGVKLSKAAMFGDRYWFDVPAGSESLIDSILSDPSIRLNQGRVRSYRLSFFAGDTESEFSVTQKSISISTPQLEEPDKDLSSPNSITLNWDVWGDDADKVKEFIVEKKVAGSFVEIGRTPGDVWQFTDDVQNPDAGVTYRVKSTTTDFSDAREFRYVNNYERISSIDTDITAASSIEISSDGNFLAAISDDESEGETKFIEIWNLNTSQKVHTIPSDNGRISDFKISYDDRYIYYVVPEKEAIYRQDFPHGGNLEKVIENTSRSGIPVTKIDVSSDGIFLLGTGGNGFVKRWNLDAFDLQYTVAENTPTNHQNNITLKGDDTQFAVLIGSLLLKDAATGETVRELAYGNSLTEFKFSRNDRYISHLTRNVQLFSVEAAEQITTFFDARGMDFHPDDEGLIALWEFDQTNITNLNRIYLYDIDAESRVGIISNDDNVRPEGIISNIQFIDSNRLAVARFSTGKSIEIWEERDSRQWKNLE